jgi:hypothetical protein
MSKQPSPRLDRLREMREAEWGRVVRNIGKPASVTTDLLKTAMKEAKGGVIGQKKRRGKK